MIFQDKTVKTALIAAILLSLLLSGCAYTQLLKEDDIDIFYNYDRLSSELGKLQRRFPDIVTQQTIGKTYEGKEIYIIRITGNKLSNLSKPGLMAIFAEHSSEHDVTVLAIGLAKYLAENYGKDKKTTDLLNEKIVYIMPMMNPDGVEFDLSGSVKPFTWRKNRRNLADGEYGVDLNRNWGHKWNIPVSEKLEKDLGDKRSLYYAGEEPFSEKETQAVRGFLLGHPNIKIVVDYHSGEGGFMQGMVLYPGPFFKKDENLSLHYKNRYEEIAEKFAKTISNENDNRSAFFVNQHQNVALQMRKHFPWYIRPFFPRNIQYPPGTSSEWIFGEMKVMSFGVEIQRNTQFFTNLQENLKNLTKNQTRGFLFLLGAVPEYSFRGL